MKKRSTVKKHFGKPLKVISTQLGKSNINSGNYVSREKKRLL